MTPEQKAIYTYPQKAYEWSLIYKRRFPEAEPHISRRPSLAYAYARTHHVRMPLAEVHFVNNGITAYKYAKFVLKARWPPFQNLSITTSILKPFLRLRMTGSLMVGSIGWTKPYG